MNSKIFIVMIFTLVSLCGLYGQCIHSRVLASGYWEEGCGAYSMQHLVGVSHPAYGQVGNLVLTSPLTNNVIRTNIVEELPKWISIYPNPAYHELHIDWMLPEDAVMQLYTVVGQAVFQEELNAKAVNVVDIHALNPGSYIIKIVTSSNKIYFSKLIKH